MMRTIALNQYKIAMNKSCNSSIFNIKLGFKSNFFSNNYAKLKEMSVQTFLKNVLKLHLKEI